MSEQNEINLFLEARKDAGLSIVEASGVYFDPLCNRWSIEKMENKAQCDFKMPSWGWKYISALRTISFENSRI
mgnify:CR=1 FL=1